MPDFYLRSIEPLISIALRCRPRKTHGRITATVKEDGPRIAKRRQQCPPAPKVLHMAEPRDAESAMASLVSSGTTRGEPPFVPGSASIASELAGKVTAIGCPGSSSPPTSCHRTARGPYDSPDLTTRQGIPGDSTDFAPRCPNHDRPSDCESA